MKTKIQRIYLQCQHFIGELELGETCGLFKDRMWEKKKKRIKQRLLPSYLVCVSANGNAEGPCEAEVRQLDLSLGVDKEVLGLQVSMQNSVRVAEGQALQQLEEIALKQRDKHNK